jgi:hypothetical protein
VCSVVRRKVRARIHRVELVSLCSIASLAYLHPRCEVPEARMGRSLLAKVPARTARCSVSSKAALVLRCDVSVQLLQVPWFAARRSGASHSGHACCRRSLRLVSCSVTLFILVRRLFLLDSDYPSTTPDSNRVGSVNQPRRPLGAVSPSGKHFARIPAANVIAVSGVAQPCADCRKSQASEA